MVLPEVVVVVAVVAVPAEKVASELKLELEQPAATVESNPAVVVAVVVVVTVI